MAHAHDDIPGHSRQRRCAPRRHAFTLIELLVVIAIVAILASLLLPAASGTLAAARSFRCQASLRSVAFDFTVFADDTLHGDRGADTSELPSNKFRLATFQDSQYGLDEFWRWDQVEEVTIRAGQPGDPLRCAEVRGDVVLRSATACTDGAVSPPQNVSYTFNMRLHRPEVRGPGGNMILSLPIALNSSILQVGNVPLVWDVDGAAAAQMDAQTAFGAPSMNSDGPLGGDRYWFPGLRHAGKLNAAFLDGSVRSSAKPNEEPTATWDWLYQPKR
jgi:prepilin-type N-terminal cleavage/methylation domain-containing protein/prepilin-type processing-associated H-X9-DG protein